MAQISGFRMPQCNCSPLMRISMVPVSHHPFLFSFKDLAEHGWMYKRECVSWGILDSSHTPVGYKIKFKGGNSPLVLCQQRPVGPRLPFNQRLEVRALRCVCALMFRKKGKGEESQSEHSNPEPWDCVCEQMCVCVWCSVTLCGVSFMYSRNNIQSAV